MVEKLIQTLAEELELIKVLTGVTRSSAGITVEKIEHTVNRHMPHVCQDPAWVTYSVYWISLCIHYNLLKLLLLEDRSQEVATKDL